VLFRGNLTRGWPANVKWRRDTFEKAYGTILVAKHKNASDIIDPSPTPLTSVLEDMDRDPPILFAWEDLNIDSFNAKLGSDYRLPKIYRARLVRERERSGNITPKSMLFFSRPGRGTGWHEHSDALNVLVYGRKRWFLCDNCDAIHSNNTHGYVDMQTFYTRIHPLVAQGNTHIHECVQRRGEAIFIPFGWGHATLSIGASLAVGFLSDVSWGLDIDLEESVVDNTGTCTLPDQ